MANCILKMEWQANYFYCLIPESGLNLYCLAKSIAPTPSPEFIQSVVAQELALVVVRQLCRLLPGAKLLAMPSIIPDNEYSLLVHDSISIELDSDLCTEVIIYTYADFIHEITSRHATQGLNLANIDNEEMQITILQGRNYRLIIKLLQDIQQKNHEKLYLKLVIGIEEASETVYLEPKILLILYKLFFSGAIPFQYSSYFIELVTNALNIWLASLSNLEINIERWSLSQMPRGQYRKISLNFAGYNAILFANNSNSELVNFVKKSAIKPETTTKSEDYVATNLKLNFPVISHYYEMPLTEVNNLAVGSVILGGMKRVNNQFLVELGQVDLVADCEDDKLTIQGARNK